MMLITLPVKLTIVVDKLILFYYICQIKIFNYEENNKFF